ncbi:MAG: response regulator transcription factor [Actinomycetota bacterium]
MATDQDHAPAGARRILVVDDDANLNEMLTTALAFSGYEVRGAANARDAEALVGSFAPDLVVLDVNLPDESGFDLCGRLRAGGDETPVIFLTARDDGVDVVTGLSQGADDYVTKPFQLGELSLRIAAILRRTADLRPAQLRYDRLVVEEDAGRVSWAGEEIKLTPREFAVLRHLLVNRERVVTKAQVAEAVWGVAGVSDDNLVETYVSRLRNKLGDAGALIETVRGFGYSLRSADGS